MSKKRRIGLDTWRLGKLEDNYLNHKKNKRGFGYLTDPIVKHRSKSKYPCKRLKGEHHYTFFENVRIPIMNKVYDHYRCIGCGKETYEINKKKHEDFISRH